MLEFGGLRNTFILPSHPGLFWPGVVAPDRIISRGQIEKKICIYAKLNCLKYNSFCV